VHTGPLQYIKGVVLGGKLQDGGKKTESGGRRAEDRGWTMEYGKNIEYRTKNAEEKRRWRAFSTESGKRRRIFDGERLKYYRTLHLWGRWS
jgi:hypothetical protein